MSSQSPRTPTGTISGLQIGSPGNLCHLDVASAVSCRVYYMGEGGGFPRVRAVMCLVVQSARGLSQHPRVSRNVLDADSSLIYLSHPYFGQVWG
jgi:hypothetical protein